MFGKLFKSSPVKNTKSNDFMQNLSDTKKEVKPEKNHQEVKTENLSNNIKQQIIDRSKNLGVKTVAFKGFLDIINEAKIEVESKTNENTLAKNDKFEEVYNNGIYHLHQFAEKPDNKENLKLALDFFTESIIIKKNRAEPYYFLAYICYLVDDIPMAEKYFKISSYLKPEQKYLMSLGIKISNSKMG